MTTVRARAGARRSTAFAPAVAFLGYLDGYAAKDILRGQGYIPCTDQGLAQVPAFCHP